MDRYYTANIFLAVGAMVIMLAALQYNVVLDRKRKWMTACLFGVIALAALCEWMGNALNGAPAEWIPLHLAVKTLELSLTPFIGVLYGQSMSTGDDLEKTALAAAVGNLVLEVASAFTGLIFRVDSANVYHHAAFYGIYTFFCFVTILYFLVRGMQTFRRYQSSGGVLIVLVALFLVGGVCIQMVDSQLNVTWLSVAVSSIMLYKFYSDLVQQVDGLTELINRWGYENYLSHFNGQGAILYFDVDHFKQINDTYGHTYGDRCLQEIADCIRTAYGLCGKCFRIGGDEFCVILDHRLNQINGLTADFIGQIKAKREEDPRLPQVSIGYVLFDTREMNIQDAVTRADAEMYAAKQQDRTPAPEENQT